MSSKGYIYAADFALKSFLSMKYESGDMPCDHHINYKWKMNLSEFLVQFVFGPVEV